MTNLNHAQDRHVFRNSARKTRNINLLKYIPRGGIRL